MTRDEYLEFIRHQPYDSWEILAFFWMKKLIALKILRHKQ